MPTPRSFASLAFRLSVLPALLGMALGPVGCGGESTPGATATAASKVAATPAAEADPAGARPDERRAHEGLRLTAFVDPMDGASRLFFRDTMKKIRDRYGDEVAITVEILPLPVSPLSMEAAATIFCAGTFGKKSAMLQAMLAVERSPGPDLIDEKAAEVGIDGKALADCARGDQGKEFVQAQFEKAKEAGLRAIPTFLLDGDKIEGVWATEVALSTIDEKLGRTSSLAPLPVTVVEDPGCTPCGVDDYLEDFQANFYPRLKIEKVPADSMEGASLKKRAGVHYTPLFIFGREIDGLSFFSSLKRQLKPLGDLGYYVTPDGIPGVLQVDELPEFTTGVGKGREDAPLVIREFADFHCGHCKHFAESTEPELDKKYVETGQVRFVFIPYPLRESTIPSAQAALCVHRLAPDQFWGYHDELFENQSKLSDQVRLDLATKRGVDPEAFKRCLADDALTKEIQENRDRAGDELFVNSTPTIYVDRLRVKGARSIEYFDKIIAGYAPVR